MLLPSNANCTYLQAIHVLYWDDHIMKLPHLTAITGFVCMMFAVMVWCLMAQSNLSFLILFRGGYRMIDTFVSALLPFSRGTLRASPGQSARSSCLRSCLPTICVPHGQEQTSSTLIQESGHWFKRLVLWVHVGRGGRCCPQAYCRGLHDVSSLRRSVIIVMI